MLYTNQTYWTEGDTLMADSGPFPITAGTYWCPLNGEENTLFLPGGKVRHWDHAKSWEVCKNIGIFLRVTMPRGEFAPNIW